MKYLNFQLRKNKVLNWCFFVLKSVSLVFLSLFIQRILFILINKRYISDIETGLFFELISKGARFDLSATFMLMLPFLFFSFLFCVTKFKIVSKLSYIFYVIPIILAYLANSIDIAYYDFTLKRSTADIFFMATTGNDFITLLPTFIKDFWYVIVTWITIVIINVLLYNKLHRNFTNKIFEKVNDNNRLLGYLYFLIISGLSIIAIRGGFQLKPIEIVNATNISNPKLAPFVLNTPFTIIKTFGREGIKERRYFDFDTLSSIYTPIHHADTCMKSIRYHKPNIVIIILESFSKEYVTFLNPSIKKYGIYTPFLDSLFEHSLVYVNAFANGRKSIEAIPAIISSIPALSENPFISSEYSSNEIESLPLHLKELGYYSAFFHGGNNGTMAFDAYAKLAGFDEYLGRNEFNDDTYYDGKWGIYDEPFLIWTAKKISQFKQPFFATIFTLSSHHPYKIPEEYKNKLPSGPIPILQSIAYTDLALKKFFTELSKNSFYKNTLFFLVADHSFDFIDEKFNNKIGEYSIPMAIYDPSGKLKGIDTLVAQQIDIMPTILNLLPFEKKYFAFGNNLLCPHKKRFAINYINGEFHFLIDNYGILYSDERGFRIYNFKKDVYYKNDITEKITDKKENYFTLFKAIIQSYTFALAKNKQTVKNYVE